MRFVAVDVETANADQSSICAIGAVEFIDLQPAREWYSLIDPEDYFDELNVMIHGIDEDAVRDAPKFPDAFPQLSALVSTNLAVCHTAFDSGAIRRSLSKYMLDDWPVQWLDSARVVRRAWPDKFGQRGYGLAPVAKFLGVNFQHHHALEDAKAAGIILCRAIQDAGIALEEWPTRVRQPIFPGNEHPHPIAQHGAEDGAFHGEVIVFTGALHIPRREAAAMAAQAGFDVGENVTKKTTVLVVGDQDARRLAGHARSSKHRKAEALIRDGSRIRVITESDFERLIASA